MVGLAGKESKAGSDRPAYGISVEDPAYRSVSESKSSPEDQHKAHFLPGEPYIICMP